MTGSEDRECDPRHARIETICDDPETARLVSRAITPDNTAEMTTRVEGDRIVTEITRETTGGLQSTVDDYVVNLGVAVQLANQDGEPSTTTTTET
jgi:hypothetical protein